MGGDHRCRSVPASISIIPNYCLNTAGTIYHGGDVAACYQAHELDKGSTVRLLGRYQGKSGEIEIVECSWDGTRIYFEEGVRQSQATPDGESVFTYVKLMDELLHRSTSILVLGCGGGNLATRLAGLGKTTDYRRQQSDQLRDRAEVFRAARRPELHGLRFPQVHRSGRDVLRRHRHRHRRSGFSVQRRVRRRDLRRDPRAAGAGRPHRDECERS